MINSIDIVLPWVDGNDPMWLGEKNRYLEKQTEIVEKTANSDIRYQNWDNLKFWFRAVEKCMPWVHQIFFLTCGHVPDWINLDCQRLKIVKHEEYIPERYLPTFNSNTIEMNVHRIQELAENFVLFNDDLFPLQSIPEEYYFKDNLVCDQAVESPIMPVDIGELSGWSCRVKANDILFINRHFQKRRVQSLNYEKWFNSAYGDLLRRNEALSYWDNFCGFHDPHMANALKKSTLRKLWELEPQTLDNASKNRFRGETDVNQYVIRYWQLCEGDFIPRKSQGKPYYVTVDNCDEIADVIRHRKYPMVSLTDGCTGKEFETVKDKINRALGQVFPERSSFEK